jgi:hypothetical protein
VSRADRRKGGLLRTCLLLALAAVAAFVWWRSPPKGVVRLDSGSDNGGFAIGDDAKRLFYGTHGLLHDVVSSVELSTGRKASRRLWGRRLQAIGPSYSSSRVIILADNGDRAPKEGRYSLISLNGDDWTIRREETRPTSNTEDMTLFDTPFKSSTETLNTPGMRDDYGVSATITGAGVEVRLRVGDKLGPAKEYPTRSRPSGFVYSPAGSIIAAYQAGTDLARLEEIAPLTGQRRKIADLKGTVESIGAAGDGIIAVRAVEDGTRLSFVSFSQSKELLDLPWSKGGSRLLGADPLGRKLYFTMAVKDPDGGKQETGWSVPTDHASLREAAKFFSAMHAWPELRWKLIGHSVEILIAVFLLCAGLFFLGTLIEI